MYLSINLSQFLFSGKRIRTKVLTTENASWTYTSRKTKSDALSDDLKKTIYDFWISPENARSTANKQDIKRVRLGPKLYSSHMTFALERTQTEVFTDLKEKYPNVKISQRLYEILKPYFLIQARPCDRETCCCRYHVEARFLFKSCMDFRKSNTPKSDQYPVFTHLTELIFLNLCPKEEGQDFHNLKCVQIKCEHCGVKKISFPNRKRLQRVPRM